MALFGFGGSKERSSSVSEGGGYSIGRSEQGSLASSSSLATSAGVSSSSQSVYNDQILQMLYGGASGATMKAASMSPQFAESARALFTGGTQFLEQLGGGIGADYLEGRLSDGGLADERIGILESDIGRFLNEQALPGIKATAIGAYGLGGARQGLAEGRAIEGATREFARGATEIRAAEQAQRDAIAQQLMASQQAGAATGLGSLPGLLDVASGEMAAELAPWESLSQIIGGPTTLTESSSMQSSDSIAQSLSESFGVSMQQAQDWMKSVSSSKKGQFSLTPFG